MEIAEGRGMHSSLSENAKAFVSWMNRNNFDIHPNVQLRYVDSYQAHSVFASGPIEVRQNEHFSLLTHFNIDLLNSNPTLTCYSWY